MKVRISNRLRCLVILLLCVATQGCILRPYKFDLHQGNPISSEKIAQIQPGMSEDQVQDVLGTPLLNDVFHTHRWDYVYYEQLGYKTPLRHHLVVYFDQGRVVRIFEETPNTSSVA